MSINPTTQLKEFAIAFLIGAIIFMVYDIFKIKRLFFKTPIWLLCLEDIIAVFLASLLSFTAILISEKKEVRLCIFLALILGAVVYNLTISKIICSIIRIVILQMKKTFKKAKVNTLKIFNLLKNKL